MRAAVLLAGLTMSRRRGTPAIVAYVMSLTIVTSDGAGVGVGVGVGVTDELPPPPHAAETASVRLRATASRACGPSFPDNAPRSCMRQRYPRSRMVIHQHR